MKITIKGWEKLSGITYKGYCLVNPIHNAGETDYMADVINLNLPQKPKLHLTFLTTDIQATGHYKMILKNPQSMINTVRLVSNEDVSTLSKFRSHWEYLLDEYLLTESVPTFNSSSYSISAQLYNMVNTSSVHTTLYGAIKELEEQIEELQKS
jgi:hypothetical protein